MTARPVAARRLAIRRLLDERLFGSQAELRGALQDLGYPVTQTTVSRDLAALGAVKKADARGASHYYLRPAGGEAGPLERQLAGRMRRFVIAIEGAANLAVLHTPPGAAQSVAVLLDRARAEVLPQVMGTIAGDDTIMVATRDSDGGPALAQQLEQLMRGEV